MVHCNKWTSCGWSSRVFPAPQDLCTLTRQRLLGVALVPRCCSAPARPGLSFFCWGAYYSVVASDFSMVFPKSILSLGWFLPRSFQLCNFSMFVPRHVVRHIRCSFHNRSAVPQFSYGWGYPLHVAVRQKMPSKRSVDGCCWVKPYIQGLVWDDVKWPQNGLHHPKKMVYIIPIWSLWHWVYHVTCAIGLINMYNVYPW